MYQKSPQAERPSKTEAIMRSFENLQPKTIQKHAKSEKGRIYKCLKHPKLTNPIPKFGFPLNLTQESKKKV